MTDCLTSLNTDTQLVNDLRVSMARVAVLGLGLGGRRGGRGGGGGGGGGEEEGGGRGGK